MKLPGQLLAPLVLLCGLAPAGAQAPISEIEPADKAEQLNLEGKAFPGRIRAKGILGLFSVKGSLSFRAGMLVWTANGAEDSATYETENMDGNLSFTARVHADDGTFVNWSGAYDGETLSDVTAVWSRAAEDDFIHDLFLPDVVTLVFKQARN